MPEVGNLQLPRALLERGVTDIVRISDARMSGTAYGTIVLHVAPEAAIGGPLALVETGDFITLDLPSRTLDVEVGEEELRRRRDGWRPSVGAVADRGYAQLFREHVLQADRGVDFDFLVGGSGHAVPPSLISAFAGPLNSVAGTALVFGVVFGGARRGWLQGPVHARSRLQRARRR